MSDKKQETYANPFTEEGITIGVLGGGQLGRMMAEAASRMGINLVCVDPKGNVSPAAKVGVPTIKGSYQEAANVNELAKRCKILTVEIEHVDTTTLAELEEKGWSVHPSAKTVALIQDKYAQKKFFADLGIPVAEFMPIESMEDLKSAGAKYGYPYMLKSRREAFDGRGNLVVRTEGDVKAAWEWGEPKGKNGLYAEKWVPYIKELAVMVARGDKGQLDAYPVVDTVQKDNICHLVLAPAQVSANAASQTRELALKCIAALHGRGVYGIEFFLTEDGKVLLNEIAPRVHNSGHYTDYACVTDQFEQHLRCISGMKLGSCSMSMPYAMMLNVLGDETGTVAGTYAPLVNAFQVPGAGVHFYGKDGIRKGRKLAHATVVAKTLSELFAKADQIIPGASKPFQTNTEKKAKKPLVGIIMGSDSDLPTMKAAADMLEAFDVPYELSIVSAHRTPRRLFSYAQSALGRGLKVIIAGAGGAAHLPGMVAAITPLPVIGVPVKTSTLSGVDSLYSIVQMPRGVPVATVAIGNSTNAGLLAVRMLGIQDSGLFAKMQAYQAKSEEGVLTKVSKVDQQGWRQYLDNMPTKNSKTVM
mmetsp:Transcript_33383/g.64529  ORF Transcript_33383/g.64529 Transcript_33383/m.64529 type:complete len:587 (-) Transcript_33383:226-1986(-)|eukprot:CAMPEP_0167788956 /NCGR_PEP_ID=MMETSP0111_2-20121227/10372_1 /TAXON_ID=91324 /ORGANISM="Lotharella globosa, Strain CCCM811" /LENGTH=586 /DNA_ID=CAMNT_0007680979 /DNA_START=49 /DNA_END=1809 /DNA_ORIENTATION=+